MQIFMLEMFINDFVSHYSPPVNNVSGGQCFALGFVLIVVQVEEFYSLPSHPAGLMSRCRAVPLRRQVGLEQGTALLVLGSPG